MAEKVNIASLSIDFDDVIKESAKYKKQIEELRKAQKNLDKTTEEGAKAFAQNEAELKNLSKSYRDNQNLAAALSKANEDLEKTMASENKSTQELYDSRRQLNQIAKNIKGDTEEEINLRNRLNKAIDEQTAAIRSQQSEFNSSKDRIGEYKQNIIEAYNEIERQKKELREQEKALIEVRDEFKKGSEEYNYYNTQINETNNQINILITGMGGLNDEMTSQDAITKILSGDIKGLAQASSEAGGATAYFTSAGKGAVKTLVAMTKASLSFLATPIGVVLAAIGAAFLLVRNAINRSEESTNKLSKAFAPFSALLSRVLKALEPLGNFLIDVLVKGLEMAEKSFSITMRGISKSLEFLGFDSAAKVVSDFTEEIEKTTKAGRELAIAEANLQREQRKARLTQLEYQKEAEKFRQIRDDESKTIQERIKANEGLGETLKEQLKTELSIAEQALKVANLRIAQDGRTEEALDRQAEALTEIADIQERITGQESEQLTNRNSLLKEAADKAKEIRQKAIDQQRQELQLFIEQQGRRAKTLEEQIKIQEKVAEKEKAINKAEYEAKEKTYLEYQTELLRIQNDLAQKRAEAAVDYARLELENYLSTNESKINSETRLTEQVLNEEQRRLDLIAEQRKKYEQERLEQGIITEIEYNSAIREINKENKKEQDELKEEYKEQELKKEAIDFENRAAIQDERRALEFEKLQDKLNRERQAEIKEAETTGADITLINQKYAQRQKILNDSVTEAKINGFQQALGSFADIAGEQTAIGKALAIADATINTYKAANLALATYPPPFGAIAAAASVASGLINVSKIVGVKEKFALGGVLKGKSHARGGIKTPYGELEGEEIVLTKGVTRNPYLKGLASAINVAGGGRKFASGGLLSDSAVKNMSIIDYDLIASKIAIANLSLPNPVVSVEEIRSVSSNVQVIENNANF